MIRRIKTKEQVQKENRRNQIIVGSVLMGLLILATVGYSLSSSGNTGSNSNSVEINGLKFTQENSYWSVNTLGRDMAFFLLPSQLSNVNINGDFNLGEYRNKPLYFVNPSSGVSSILTNLGPYVERYQEVCLEGSNCLKEDLIVKNCNENVIVFEESNVTGVLKKDSCVYLSGNTVESSEAFLYKVFGIL